MENAVYYLTSYLTVTSSEIGMAPNLHTPSARYPQVDVCKASRFYVYALRCVRSKWRQLNAPPPQRFVGGADLQRLPG